MENASKALIIAGAILLSILLISLGIMIFSQAQSVVDGSGMTEAEVNSFNAKFTKYQGNIKGSMVRSLVQEALANNNNDSVSDERYVTINSKNGSINPDTTKSDANLVSLAEGTEQQPNFGNKFSNTQTYTVDFQYNGSRIAIINIK